MSMADKLRRNIKKDKERTSEEEVRDSLNSAASKSLKQFIQRLDTGEIPIDNISDFVRVLGAYKEINEIESALEGSTASSALPEINQRQERVFNDLETEGKLEADEEGTIDVSALSTDDVSDLIRDMDTAQNKDNEETF